MGANKRWKRQAKRLTGECQRVCSYCELCKHEKECYEIMGEILIPYYFQIRFLEKKCKEGRKKNEK